MTICIHISTHTAFQRQHGWLPFGKYLIRTTIRDGNQNDSFRGFVNHSRWVSRYCLEKGYNDFLPNPHLLAIRKHLSAVFNGRQTYFQDSDTGWPKNVSVWLVALLCIRKVLVSDCTPWVLGILTVAICAFTKSSKAMFLNRRPAARYRAASGSPGICHYSFLSIFHA